MTTLRRLSSQWNNALRYNRHWPIFLGSGRHCRDAIFELDQLTHVSNRLCSSKWIIWKRLGWVPLSKKTVVQEALTFRFHELGLQNSEWDLDVTYKHSGDQSNPEIYTNWKMAMS